LPQWIVLVDNGEMVQNVAKWDSIHIGVFVCQVLDSKPSVMIEEALMAALKTLPAKAHKDVIIHLTTMTTIITTTMTTTITTTTTMITTTIHVMNGILIAKDLVDQALKIVIATVDVNEDVINT